MTNNDIATAAADTHAIVLAAGLGTRLKENTKATPKCLVPVSARPILDRLLDNLVRLGIGRATIVVGYLDHAIREFAAHWVLANNAPIEVDFVLNERYAETGSLCSLEMALRHLDGTRDERHLLLIEGDVVIDIELLARLLRRTAATGAAATLLAPYEPALNGTFATVAQGVVTGWLHESVRAPGFELEGSFKTVNLTTVPRGHARHRLLAQASAVIAQRGPKAPLEYAMQNLVAEGLRIDAVLTDGLPWFEVDTPEDLAIANDLFPPLPAAA